MPRARAPRGACAAAGACPACSTAATGEPLGFDADARELRLALAASGAVLDLSVDGGKATPVVLKEAQRHPVRGETVHVDLLRVRLDEAIQRARPARARRASTTHRASRKAACSSRSRAS